MYNEQVGFDVTVSLEHEKSYLKCNTITSIDKRSNSSTTIDEILSKSTYSDCRDCSGSSVRIVERQLADLLSPHIDEQVKDNLHWHLSQIITNQHYSSLTGGPQEK